MSNEETSAEELARDLHEAATEARARISGTPVEKWPLIAETERAIYRAMAFRALHYEEVQRVDSYTMESIEGELSMIESCVSNAQSIIDRLRKAAEAKSA